MADRTVTISGLSKTYSVTGWRIGWAIAPPALTGGIRKMHDFLTVAAPTPFHDAGVAALSLPDAFYRSSPTDYQAKRDLMLDILERHGFTATSRRRVLRDGRRQPVRLLVRLGVRAVPGEGDRRGDDARQQLLHRSRGGAADRALLFLEARRDAARSGSPAARAFAVTKA